MIDVALIHSLLKCADVPGLKPFPLKESVRIPTGRLPATEEMIGAKLEELRKKRLAPLLAAPDPYFQQSGRKPIIRRPRNTSIIRRPNIEAAAWETQALPAVSGIKPKHNPTIKSGPKKPLNLRVRRLQKRPGLMGLIASLFV